MSSRAGSAVRSKGCSGATFMPRRGPVPHQQGFDTLTARIYGMMGECSPSSSGARRAAIIPQIDKTITAPTTAPIKPAPSPGRYQPKDWPRNVATKAPTMPRILVSMNPLGSFLPGVMNFAITPATKPMMIVR
jgi:hypothetical protein